MDYYLNPAALSAAFPVPSDVVDRHIRLAGAVQLKVLLFALRHQADGADADAAAQALGIPAADVGDALRFWCDAGILLPRQAPVPAEPEKPAEQQKKAVRAAAVKPTREEIARRGAESEEIRFLLSEAQQKFGRGLRQSEASTLVWLHDDEGMSVALILMLVEFARSQKKCNVGFIERTAVDWINSGVDSISAAEQRISDLARQQTAWGIVSSAMGLEQRLPSAKELTLADLWVTEWKFSREMLRAAYDQCVDATSRVSMAYIKKILERWHRDGVTSPDAIPRAASAKKPESYAAYDLDLVEAMLDRDD